MTRPQLHIRREWFRRVFQVIVLVTFVVFTVFAPSWGLGWVPTQVLSRLDPLVGLTILIASRALVAYAAAALITVAVTLVFGRAWCGWVCPIGTVIDLVPGRMPTRKAPLPAWWRFGKFVTLAIVLAAAIFGTLWPMFLDPITIATRPLQELAMPAVGIDAVGQSVGAFLSRDAIGLLAMLSLVPLVVAVGLNAVAKRFWCESVCPLGGLLGAISLGPGVRRRVDHDACISCAKCATACPTRAIDRARDFESSAAECVTCLRCLDVCPTDAVKFSPFASDAETPAVGLDRREALGLLGTTGASLAFTLALPHAHTGEEILRPPGTTEARLAQQCVRCGACYSACPTGSLLPSTSLTSTAGLWTPMLEAPRPAHCSLNCNLCAQVCPTDALHIPTPIEAERLGLGAVAHVDRNWCIAWAKGKDCMACQSACPISGAIYSTTEYNPGWRSVGEARVPHVNTDLCVACGQCTLVCPARQPAIVVVD